MSIPKHIVERFEDLAKYNQVTKDTTFGGIYAWYFPGLVRDSFLPLYIGQSSNVYQRCQKHHQGLDYAFRHKVQPAGGKYTKYYEMKHILELAGVSERPKEEFKVLCRFDGTPVDRQLSEYLYIYNHGANYFGFNSPLPAELYYMKDVMEEEWETIVKETVNMCQIVIEDYLEKSKLGEFQKNRLRLAGVNRGEMWLKGEGFNTPLTQGNPNILGVGD